MRPDEALLAGLLHNIGKVYIIARTPKDAVHIHVDDAVLRDWHPGIGQALIENWKLPEDIAVAVGGQLESSAATRSGGSAGPVDRRGEPGGADGEQRCR
jgi:HD-like signal output (HDOD) protein